MVMSHTGRGMGGVAGKLLGYFGWRLTLWVMKWPIVIGWGIVVVCQVGCLPYR